MHYEHKLLKNNIEFILCWPSITGHFAFHKVYLFVSQVRVLEKIFCPWECFISEIAFWLQIMVSASVYVNAYASLSVCF